MARSAASTFARGLVLSIAAILVIFPLVMLVMSGNAEYYLNVIFYTQRIFLIASLFLLLLFIVLKDRIRNIGWVPPDADDSVVYTAMSLSLVFLLGFLHVNFDTVLRMEALDVGTGTMTVGFGGPLADTFDLGRISVDSYGITKVIELNNLTQGAMQLRLHSGWEGEGPFASHVFLSLNDGPEMDISDRYAPLASSAPSWMDVELPGDAFRNGTNTVLIRAEGPSQVFLSSQWVYHDAKTLGADQRYYGQEALVYLRMPPDVPPLFTEAFRYQLFIKLFAIFLLFIALFGFSALSLAWNRFRGRLMAIAAVSLIALLAVLYIQDLWVHLSALTAAILPLPLGLFGDVYTDFSDPDGAVIGVNTFFVRIAKSCSGMESVGMFILFFPLIMAFNWERMDRRLIIPMFVGGMAGAFLVNLLRLVCIILVGAFLSADLALDVFHTNLGWILMLGYFALFNEMAIRCRRRGPA